MPMKYAEAYVELAWRKENYDAGERQVQASIRTIGQQASDMAAKVAAASKSTSADVYELQGSVYKLAETVADVPKEMEKVEERTLATGAAMKNLGGVVGLVSPQLGGMISIAGQLQAKFGVLSQANGATATAATRLGTAFAGLSTTVLAFMGTPVGLMITGFTAIVGLLAASQKEGESLGDVFLRLTDILHGMHSAQEKVNKEKERDIELSKMLFEAEQKRLNADKDPGVVSAEGDLKDLYRFRSELQTEINQSLKEEQKLLHNIGQDARDTVKVWEQVEALRTRRRAATADLNTVEHGIKQQEPIKAAAEKQANLNALASILPFDPKKSAAQNLAESEAKVRQRETQERLEQEAGRTRRNKEADENARESEERRTKRDEELARKEEERARKTEEREERTQRARRTLRGMGLDQGERAELGAATAVDGLAGLFRSLSSGMERPTERRAFESMGVEDIARQIQQGAANREEKELMKKQTSDISDIAEGKKTLKVEVMKAPQAVAVFAR